MNIKFRVLFAHYAWNALPGSMQILISRIYATIYKTPISRYFIQPFCRWHQLDHHYLNQFISPKTKTHRYISFQDFFTRMYKVKPTLQSNMIWPCEGYVCEQNLVKNLEHVKIKGESTDLRNVFTNDKKSIPDDYFFTNIFLHNQNYHRIHSPIDGVIRRIEKVPGDLQILRPWFYKKNEVSRPALTNERVNVDILDKNGKIWFLSIVGGMVVGSIELLEKCNLGIEVLAGDELAVFYLGSTLCLASPICLKLLPYLNKVRVGEKLPTC